MDDLLPDLDSRILCLSGRPEVRSVLRDYTVPKASKDGFLVVSPCLTPHGQIINNL